MITWDPLLIKALFSFVTEFSYISGKGSETALLFKVHISKIQSGAHTSETAGQEMVKQLIPFPAEDILPKYKASSQPSCSKAKCIRLVLKPPPPTSPRNTWSTAAFQHPSKPQYCPFLWVLVSRIWSSCFQIQRFPLWKPHPVLLPNLGSEKLSITHLPSLCHLNTTDKYN